MTGIEGLSAFTGQAGGEQWSLSLQTLLLLSAMAFLPAILLMMTGFTRIIIVLGCCVRPWAPPRRRQTRCC